MTVKAAKNKIPSTENSIHEVESRDDECLSAHKFQTRQDQIVWLVLDTFQDKLTRPHWSEILERLMLKSEDDRLYILFYFRKCCWRRMAALRNGVGDKRRSGESLWVGRSLRSHWSTRHFGRPLFVFFSSFFLIRFNPQSAFCYLLGHSSPTLSRWSHLFFDFYPFFFLPHFSSLRFLSNYRHLLHIDLFL